MQRLRKIMDDIDDVIGILHAATSRTYLAIVFLSVVLIVFATYAEGVRGLLVSLLLCGAAVSAAGLAGPRK